MLSRVKKILDDLRDDSPEITIISDLGEVQFPKEELLQLSFYVNEIRNEDVRSSIADILARAFPAHAVQAASLNCHLRSDFRVCVF